MTSEETECDREPMEALIFDRPSDPADLPMTAFRITAGITQPPPSPSSPSPPSLWVSGSSADAGRPFPARAAKDSLSLLSVGIS